MSQGPALSKCHSPHRALAIAYNSSCPDQAHWLERITPHWVADLEAHDSTSCKVVSKWVKGGCNTARPLVFLNVGANKGFMIASMLQQFNTQAGFSNVDWHAEMGEFVKHTYGVLPESISSFLPEYCGACLACREHPRPIAGLKRSIELDIHAFEIAHVNVQWLRWAFARFGVRASLLRAAASNATGRVKVPTMKRLEDFGDERASVRGAEAKMVHHGKNVDCPSCRPFRCYDYGTCWHYMSSIALDTYVEQEGLRQIHFVSIDTEGHDALVLEGLKETLARGAIDVLEFEFNTNLGSWNARSSIRRSLRGTLAQLEEYAYSCFWQGSNGCIAPASGECWQNGFERVGWSNLICAARPRSRSAKVGAASAPHKVERSGKALAELWRIARECQV